MRKGVIFSIASTLLFTSLILASASLNTRMNDEERMISEEIPARIDRDAYNTVSNDIARLFKTRVNTTSNTTIIDEMPNNISKAVNNYIEFLNKTIKNVEIIKREEAVYISNHTRINYGINKTWLNMTSNETINYYNIKINATSTQNITTTDWVWEETGAYVNLTIRDSTGAIALINGSGSGRVNTSRNNNFSITYANGKTISVTLKDYLLINTTLPINTSITTNLKGDVYTGHEVRINNTTLELTKEYKTIVR